MKGKSVASTVRCLLAVSMVCVFGQPLHADEMRVLNWPDLLPEDPGGLSELSQQGAPGGTGAGASWFEHDESSTDIPDQPRSVGVVESLSGARVMLPGFVVPLELADNGKVTEFLLVPYVGACIHYPPPPANQIVYVTLPKPVEIGSLWLPYWVAGEIRTEARETDLANAGYTMQAEYMEDFE